MNQKNTKPHIILLFVSSILFNVVAILLFILSCKVSKDEYGTSIDFNKDYLLIVLIALETLSLSMSYLFDKNTGLVQMEYKLLVSLEVFAYTLGIFFKSLAKHYAFNSIYVYLLVGLVAGCFLVAFILEALDKRKHKEIKKEA